MSFSCVSATLEYSRIAIVGCLVSGGDIMLDVACVLILMCRHMDLE